MTEQQAASRQAASEPPAGGLTSAAGMQAPALTRRERARAATIAEIKQTALHLMREQGTTDLRFSDIAREMGMTAPALYRYFADRDELLTELIVDAYDALGDAVATARDQVPIQDPTGRLHAVGEAYRHWARSEPEQFALILGMPVPGYAAPPEGPTTEAAIRAMTQLKSLFFEAMEQDLLERPLISEVSAAMQECVHEDHSRHPGEPVMEPATFQSILTCWSLLHGFASLEAYGHLEWLPENVRDEVFKTNIELAARSAGLPLRAAPPPRSAPAGGIG